MRPKEFDEQEKLDIIMRTFWARGYQGTSIQDLEDATGLTRPSIYNCFGQTKNEIFEKALDHYLTSFCGCWLEHLESASTAKEGIKKLLNAAIASQCDKCNPKGCLLALATLEQESCGNCCQGIIHKALKKMKQLLQSKFKKDVENGELPDSFDIKGVTATVICILQGLAISYKSGASKAELQAISKTALQLIQ